MLITTVLMPNREREAAEGRLLAAAGMVDIKGVGKDKTPQRRQAASMPLCSGRGLCVERAIRAAESRANRKASVRSESRPCVSRHFQTVGATGETSFISKRHGPRAPAGNMLRK